MLRRFRRRLPGVSRRGLALESLESRRVFDISGGAVAMPVYPGDEGIGVVEEEVAPRPDDSDTIGESATRLEWESGYASVDASLETASDQDVFQVALPDLGRLVLYSGDSREWVDGEPAVYVLSVSLVDASGNSISATGAGHKGEATYSGLEAGDYYVVVNGSADGAIDYWLSLEGMRLDDSGEIGASATPLDIDYGYAGINGLVEGTGDRDVFRLELDAGTDYLSIYGWADTETVTGWQLTLADAAGNVVTPQTPTEFQDPAVQLFGAMDAGTYYIIAEGSSTVDGGYWLNVETIAPVVYDVEVLDFTEGTGEDGIVVYPVDMIDGNGDQVYIRTLYVPSVSEVAVDPMDRVENEEVIDDEVIDDEVIDDEVIDDEVIDGEVIDGEVIDEVVKDETYQPGDEIFWTLGGVETTSVEESPWRNSDSPLDVNGDGHFGPLDVILVINLLDQGSAGSLAEMMPRAAASVADSSASESVMYPDVNGDGRISPTDAIWLINQIASPVDAESEADAAGTRLADWADPNIRVDDPTLDEAISDEDLGSGLWEGDTGEDLAADRLGIWADPSGINIPVDENGVPLKDYTDDEELVDEVLVEDEFAAVDEVFATIADAV